MNYTKTFIVIAFIFFKIVPYLHSQTISKSSSYKPRKITVSVYDKEDKAISSAEFCYDSSILECVELLKDGTKEIKDVPIGKLKIKVKAENYYTHSETIDTRFDDIFIFTLEKVKKILIKGKVENDKDMHLSNIDVKLKLDNLKDTTSTNNNGIFEFEIDHTKIEEDKDYNAELIFTYKGEKIETEKINIDPWQRKCDVKILGCPNRDILFEKKEDKNKRKKDKKDKNRRFFTECSFEVDDEYKKNKNCSILIASECKFVGLENIEKSIRKLAEGELYHYGERFFPILEGNYYYLIECGYTDKKSKLGKFSIANGQEEPHVEPIDFNKRKTH